MMKISTVDRDVREGIQSSMADSTQIDDQIAPGTKGVLLQAKGLTVRTAAGVSLLSDISFHIETGDLVLLTGLSRSGRSTLLQSLAGLLRPGSGEILVDGVNLYDHLNAFRSLIGFVPAEYALHQNLTVTETLEDGAVLRLPQSTPVRERSQRVLSLLETFGLTRVTDRRVGALSPVDRRRLSIAVELLGYPGLLLLDQSAEPLTPFEEVQITILLRELSRQGLTVVQVNERSRSAGASDKVIFLAPGGLLAWFGPTEETFNYLRRLVPGGIAKDLFGLHEALEILANPRHPQGVEWAKRFKDNPAYQKYVDDPLHNRYPDLMLQSRPLLRLRLREGSKEKLPPAATPRASMVQKFILLIRRNFRLLWREKMGWILLAGPPLIAFFSLMLFSPLQADPARLPLALGVIVFLVTLTAAWLVQNEIFKERAVFRRENRFSSMLFPYILSKAWLAGILAIYQGMVWAMVVFMAAGTAGGFQALPLYAITFCLIAFIGGVIGLVASGLSRTAVMITSWILLFTIPQFLLSGSLIPLINLRLPFNFLAGLNPSRYALEALLTVSGYGTGLGATPLGQWLVLAIMSLCLVVLSAGIQHKSGRATA